MAEPANDSNGEVDADETMELIKQAYEIFNQVLETGSKEDKSKAAAMMNTLRGRLKDKVQSYDEENELSTKAIVEYTRDTDNPSIRELYKKVGEIESVVKETEEILEKQNPKRNKKRRRKKTGGLRRKMRGIKVRRFKGKKKKVKG